MHNNRLQIELLFNHSRSTLIINDPIELSPINFIDYSFTYYFMAYTNQDIIEMVTLTYSCDTQATIQTVESTLIDWIFKDYARSITQLENILVKEKHKIDNNCKKAIANLIKVAVQQLITHLGLLNRNDDDVLGKHKKLLFSVEHIFDNKQICPFLKVPISQVYVDLFVFFTPENYPRLLSKTKYHFNTKQQVLALTLTEAYINRKTPLKYRFPYCQQALQIIIYNLQKKLSTIADLQTPLSEDNYRVINKFMEVIKDLWIKMTFEKFQSLFHKLFTSQSFIKILKSLSHPIFYRWRGQLNTIFNIITFSLGRCSLYRKYQQLMQIVQRAVLAELDRLMNEQWSLQGRERQGASLSLIASAIQFKLIHIDIPCIQLYLKLIYPNYMLIEKYLQEQAHNLPEIINFLDDASFYMVSQSPQILRNKILIHFCKAQPSINLAFRVLLSTFYTRHSLKQQHQCNTQTTFSHHFAQGLNAWLKIEQSLGKDNHFEIILMYTALAANLFITDLPFMRVIEQFVCRHQQQLFTNSNKKIVFYTLAIYKSYMDDIFGSTSSSAVRQHVILLALNTSNHNQLVTSFALSIIQEKITQKPPFQQFSYEIAMITQAAVDQYRPQLVPLIIVVFQNYGNYIEQQIAVNIIKQALNAFQKYFSKDQANCLQLFKQFFNIESCTKYFSFLIEELLSISVQNMQLIQNSIEQFIDVMGKGLQVCKQLPLNFESILCKFEFRAQNIAMMQNINKFIMYTNDGKFVNWLAIILTKHDLNIYEILLLHNLIYFGHKLLNQSSIKAIISEAYLQRIHKSNCFDYRNGKINLIFLFLLKYMWNQTNDVLLNSDWNGIIERGRQLLSKVHQLGKNNQIGTKPFIQQIYDLIYLQENTYRWKYDIEMFIIHQLDLFKYKIKDKYQFMYANLSFIACTMNILRANDFIQNQYIQDGSDSDDSLNPHSILQKEYRGTQHILDRFVVPAHLREVDYFSAYRRVIANLKKDENSKKWLDILFKATFRADHRSSFQNVMKTQKNAQGKYRKITRIRRSMLQND